MILGKVSFWVDWGDGRVYYGEMGVWARVGGGAGEFKGHSCRRLGRYRPYIHLPRSEGTDMCVRMKK